MGGHIEVNELPEEACIREAHEESGLLKWYTKEELKNAYNIQENILTLANEALELLGEK